MVSASLGNPFVTAEVTRRVCLLNRLRALNLYLQEVEELLFDLSLHYASEELLEYNKRLPVSNTEYLEKVRLKYVVLVFYSICSRRS